MRKLFAALFLLIYMLSPALAGYSWSGSVAPGEVIQVNNLTLNVTKTLSNETIVLIQADGKLLDVLQPNQSKSLENITFKLFEENRTLILTMNSTRFLSVLPYAKKQVPAKRWEYSWSGIMEVNQTLYLPNMTLELVKGPLLEIKTGDRTAFLGRGNASVGNVFISVNPLSNTSIKLELSSNEPLSVTFNPVIITKVVNRTVIVNQTNETVLRDLKTELAKKNRTIANLTALVNELKKKNSQLQQQVSQLKEKLKGQPNVKALNARIVNLTKQNRELKAELANLTNKYNQLKAENAFLKQQNSQYQQIIKQVMNEQSSEAKENYVKKAEKEKTIGSILIKALLASLLITIIIAYALYKKKRSWEHGGL